MPLDTTHLERMMGQRGPRDVPPFCLACGYNLTGAASARCPECGHYFVHKEWRREVERVKQQVNEAKDSILLASVGLTVAIAGLVIRVFGVLMGTGGLVAGGTRGIAIVCGVAAVFLGLGALRAGMLPAWAREHFDVKPKPSTAVGAIAAGAGLVAISLLSPW